MWLVKRSAADSNTLVYKRPADWGGDDLVDNYWVSASPVGASALYAPQPQIRMYYYGRTGGLDGFFWGDLGEQAEFEQAVAAEATPAALTTAVPEGVDARMYTAPRDHAAALTLPSGSGASYTLYGLHAYDGTVGFGAPVKIPTDALNVAAGADFLDGGKPLGEDPVVVGTALTLDVAKLRPHLVHDTFRLVAFYGAGENAPAAHAASATRTPTAYPFEDGVTLYGLDVARSNTRPAPAQGVQWTRRGASKGSYLTISGGVGADAQTGLGRGRAYVLSRAVPATGGEALLMLFRSSNVDWSAVDDRTLAIDSATQQMVLAEGSQRLASTGYAGYSMLSADERGVQPAHMAGSFVEYLEEKILKVALGEEQSGEGALISEASFANATIHESLSVGGDFQVMDGAVTGKSLNLDIGAHTDANADTKFLNLGTSSDSVFSVSGAGHVSAKKVTVTSDCRLKRNIAIEAGDGCLAALNELDCLSYTFDEAPEKRLRGVSAQAVREVLPELVTEDANTGMLSVDYSGLAAVLVSGMNELSQQQQQLRELLLAQRASA
ncbi:MAG: hypothetical protein CL862_00775 [Cyanobium sp. NAT70]|nr:hypothetical protein [Cyanobium sp. NAT70]